MAKSSGNNNHIAHFEQSLDELENLVAHLEEGDLSLDDSLKSFERGVTLFRNCQTALEQAELRVKMLMDPDDPEHAEPFDEETGDAGDSQPEDDNTD